MLLAGLDIGSSSCKITVYKTDGEYLGRIYRDYPHMRTANEHEIDPSLIWQAVQDLIGEAASKYPGIGGIGVTSFGETFVLLDAADEPICNALLYTDPRGGDECAALCEKLGRERLAHITGINPHPMYSLPKLMWIKNNRPDHYCKARRLCQMMEYIVYMLTGTAQIDYSLATRVMAFDVRALEWSREICEAAGIDATLLSKTVPTGTFAGTLKKEVAERLGLGADTIVVSAGQDQVAAAIGSGVFDAGSAVDGSGTVECITPVYEGIPSGTGMRDNNYVIIPYVEPGKYVCYAFTYTGGSLVQWFTDNLAGYSAADAKQSGVSIHNILEGNGLLDKPTGLLVLPHFAGAATPYMDYGARGVITGLSLATTQRDIYHAIMEGICYELRLNMDRLRGSGVTFDSLRATGGGANSRAWMQMKADILNVPLTALRTVEAGGAGAAMMAGVAAGVYPDLRSAAKVMVSERETYTPRPDVTRLFDEAYEKYAKLYAAVRPLT